MTEPIEKGYFELNADDLYSILQIRQEVFVVEQDCAYLDADGLDQKARHIFIKKDKTKEVLAYARILSPGMMYEEHVAIGRVLVNISHRKKGLGRQIMLSAIEYCQNNYKEDIKISAQTYLNEFYESLGFIAVKGDYLEDGIPHRAMILKNNK